jgi:general secretion pathway protein D
MSVAQTYASTAASEVTDIQLQESGADHSVFELTLSPRPGSYSTLSSDPSNPTLLLMRARRGSNMPAQDEYAGLVRSIELQETDTGLAVKFSAAAPAKASVKQAGGDRLIVTVSKLAGAEAIGSRPVGSEGEVMTTAQQTAPPMLEDEGYELVMLKYADVSEIVGLLSGGGTVKPNNVFIRREPGFGSMGTNGSNYQQNASDAQKDEQPVGESVDNGLAIDRRLNAIWVRGSPERIARIKEQIALIDVPVDSVILETQFVELTEAGARSVGIDLTNANGQVAVGTLQTGGFSPYSFDPNKIVPSASIQAAIYAQIQKGNGRIVSTPRIAAQSGSTAKILTGDALPILTSITLSGVNGVSQQVQYVNVGVTLQIAPRVSSDGYVTSHIYGVVSSVSGYSQGYPTISQREAETSASVRDGETFVIGGLTQDNSLSSRSKVPILGDIPVLGQAFRVDKSTKSKTDLYIVITPHIVRHRRGPAANLQAQAQAQERASVTQVPWSPGQP